MLTTEDISCLDDLTNEDRIDSLDLIDLINELEGLFLDREVGADDEDLSDLLAELHHLRGATEPNANGTWNDGISFISDEGFEDYAMEYAEDIGAIGSQDSWPADYIDWSAAAIGLQTDFTQCEINGLTYWYR